MSTEINLESIDWNNLSVEAFQELHSKLEVNSPDRKARTQNNKVEPIKINNKFYMVPYKDVMRLKNMRSQKSKEKLQEELIKKYPPIVEI